MTEVVDALAEYLLRAPRKYAKWSGEVTSTQDCLKTKTKTSYMQYDASQDRNMFFSGEPVIRQEWSIGYRIKGNTNAYCQFTSNGKMVSNVKELQCDGAPQGTIMAVTGHAGNDLLHVLYYKDNHVHYSVWNKTEKQWKGEPTAPEGACGLVAIRVTTAKGIFTNSYAYNVYYVIQETDQHGPLIQNATHKSEIYAVGKRGDIIGSCNGELYVARAAIE